MAGFHPFRSFQRNRKLWLAILGVGTIISFIFLPAFMQLFSGFGGGGRGPVEFARTARFGKVDQMTIESLQQDRQNLVGFHEVLFRNLFLRTQTEKEQYELNYRFRIVLSMLSSSSTIDGLIEDWLILNYAKSQGMSVSQETVVNHLKLVGGEHLTDKIFTDTLKAVGLTEQRWETILTNALLVRQMKEVALLSQQAVTPATDWGYFQRMTRKVSLEVAAVPVKEYSDKVGDPTLAQLTTLFNDNKFRPYNPESEESGFVIPPRIEFQYVQAVPGPALLASITDEQIKDYYDANRDTRFLRPVRPTPNLPDLPGTTSPFRGGLGGIRGTVPGMGGMGTPFSPTRPQGGSSSFSDVLSNLHLAAPEGETPETETPETGTPETPATPSMETPAVTPAEETPADSPADSPETSAVSRRATTRFVSYQTETEIPAAGTEPAPEATPETAEKTEAAMEIVAETSTKEEPAEGAATEAVPEAAEINLVDELYYPLDEVKDMIRNILAREKAEEALRQIEGKMREYFLEYVRFFESKQTPPPLPDLSAFVREQGLELVTVPEGTIFDTVKSDFVRSREDVDYLVRMFREIPTVFEPMIYESLGNKTLLRAVSVVEEFRPEKLEDVEDRVLARWTELKARPLALAKAEELAAEAKASGKTLAETFAGREGVYVAETEPFKWMTYGPGLDEIIGVLLMYEPRLPQRDVVREKGVTPGNEMKENKVVTNVGDEFMKVAYSLQVGDIGVVFNEPKSVAYVLRLVATEPSEDALWEQFQEANPRAYRPTGSQQDYDEAYEAWLDKVREETGFRWVNHPDTLRFSE